MTAPELNDSVRDEHLDGNDNARKDTQASPEPMLHSDGSQDEAVKTEKLPDENTGQPVEDGNIESSDPQKEGNQVLEEGNLPEEEELQEPGGTQDVSAAQHVDYSQLSREALLTELKKLISTIPVSQIGDDADIIKINFYKKHKAENEKRRKKFIEEGGKLEDFKTDEDPVEADFKELFKQYRDQKADYNRQIEAEKQENLKAKYAIIEEIKDLINRSESFNVTFQEFRELQKRWRSIGPVPQQNVKDLWDTYNHNIEKFYDYIKINKELRDLDFKKNLESKVHLCEKAEELLLEPDIVKAFHTLQELHEEWRDTGPVPLEMREEIWNRFKEITSKINRRHQDHFESLKEEQVKNLEQKALLCEQAEAISTAKIANVKEWDEQSKAILNIQKVWKTIGFAPKKDNNAIYQRFRAACDEFFKRKRDFFVNFKEEQQNNLQLKTELCLQAEALKDSTEWKKTTEDLINIQKRWKEIGPVPRKYADQLWKRFRFACDEFFNHKSAFFANIDSQYEGNLNLKKDLVNEIENYIPTDNVDENFRSLKEFQRRWTDIGFVPLKDKEEIQRRYKEAIGKHFDNLKMDDERKNLLKFRNKLDNMQQKPRGNQKIRAERERLIGKLKQLENDIVVWENNIGFFTKSKNAETMINEVQRKIDEARNRINEMEERIRLIDMHQSES